MYLKNLYKHNKFICILVCVFALAQLINNIRQDIAISPIYAYGMYSQKITPSTLYTVPEVFIDNKQLQAKDFTPQQWDNITLPITKYYAQQDWNLAMWQQDIHRLLPFADSIHFANNLSESDFKLWYKDHLQHLLGIQADSVKIVFSDYSFNGQFKKIEH